MNYQISYEANIKSEDIQILNDGIMEQAKQKKGMKQLDFFAFFIRDEDGKIIGGCGSDNMYGGMYMGQLWVDESLRGKSYGTQLMQKTEVLAKESKCNFDGLKPNEIAGVDLFIADENYLKKGYGTLTLTNFIKEYIQEKFTFLITDPIAALALSTVLSPLVSIACGIACSLTVGILYYLRNRPTPNRPVNVPGINIAEHPARLFSNNARLLIQRVYANRPDHESEEVAENHLGAPMPML